MENSEKQGSRFPEELRVWAGHHSGGVKRLFDPSSGRPGEELLRTQLISRLENWTERVASGADSTPRIVLLVGGPGNGKTEAIEHTIRTLDKCLAADDKLVELLANSFRPPRGQPVGRIAKVDAGKLAATPRALDLSIVQDATTTAGHEGRTAPMLLIEELLSLLGGSEESYYLCCVNRGILDDALIYSIDADNKPAVELLESITRSVSLSADARPCWPLSGYPDIAIWPMDAESLLVSSDGELASPASTLLAFATDPTHWPAPGTCAAGVRCPFCNSQKLLISDDRRTALLRILRWHELASGKRWSFRDLFSLVSYLFVGNDRRDAQGQQGDPCSWAAYVVEQDIKGQRIKAPNREQLKAPFELVAASYQHSLFHCWDPAAAITLRKCISDLKLDKAKSETRALLGLQHFLTSRKDSYLPATIESSLSGLAELLDPAMASSDARVMVSARTEVLLSDIDMSFSRSIIGGIDSVKKYRVLSKNEMNLLERLARADTELSSAVTRRRNPSAASKIQYILRDFACRLVRRSLCARSAVVADAETLQAFQCVVEDEANGQRLFDVAMQVKNLLNQAQGFEVSLTTTFGQPLPPRQRQATLVVPTRQVKPLKISTDGRPRAPICFLLVGKGQSRQSIPLTYDLFKAVRELERGMSPASLPGTVVALLDTTKARLSGPIVRDPEVLEDSVMRIGTDGTEVRSAWDGFAANKGESQS